MRKSAYVLAVVAVSFVVVSVLPVWSKAEEGTAAPQEVVIKLPEPKLKGEKSLEEVMAKRRSVRQFQDKDISIEEKGQLLWAAQGITSEKGQRTAPSAGAAYPLEIYLADRSGAYKYVPATHSLKKMAEGDLRAKLGRGAVGTAAVDIVIAAVPEKMGRYGARAEKFIYLEAGHVAQNVLLEAVALGLGAVPVGGFSDADVKKVLGMPEGEEVLYMVPVGVPTGG